MTEIYHGATLAYSYSYNTNGGVDTLTDHKNSRKYLYEYDMYDRATSCKVYDVTTGAYLQNDAQLGVKYQINKPNGKTTTRSMEFHYNHAHKGYKPHWQQNSWNTWNNSVSSMYHWTWWGKRI